MVSPVTYPCAVEVVTVDVVPLPETALTLTVRELFPSNQEDLTYHVAEPVLARPVCQYRRSLSPNETNCVPFHVVPDNLTLPGDSHVSVVWWTPAVFVT